MKLDLSYINKFKSKFHTNWRYLLIGAPFGLLAILFIYVNLFPVKSQYAIKTLEESCRLYDRNGKFLREVVNNSGARRRLVNFNNISPLVINATIAIEDANFYSHGGIDLKAVVRAIFQNITHGEIFSGASTITMQSSRILFNLPRSLSGKIFQIINTLRIEKGFKKEEILHFYLNSVPYGAGTIGIEAASQRYFNKPNSHLSLAEAAFLSGLPWAPSALNPIKNKNNAAKRGHQILKRMLITQVIDSIEYERAMREPINIDPKMNVLEAMHFTEYLLLSREISGDVYVTIDKDIQTRVENLVENHVNTYKKEGLTNASVVIIDNNDCSILAMVGSSDYFHPDGGAINGAVSLRQPGSTLKPFTYALAFENGKTPVTVVADIETQYVGEKGDLFLPHNYSGEYYGPVVMHDALGKSLNVPAIKTLNMVGIQNLLDKLKMLNFESLKEGPDYYGLGLTLGNGEVTLLELVQGYAAFARNGISCKARLRKGDVIEKGVQVFSPEICFLITDILSNESLREQAFGMNNPLLFDFPIAAKTGTSANWRDNWVVGYTKDFTIGVWAGDFEGNSMFHMSGSVGAGPLFNKIANLLVYRGSLSSIPNKPENPTNIKSVQICPLSGMLPNEYCSNIRSFNLLENSIPNSECDVHKLVRIDKRNNLLASEKCPGKFVKEKIYEILPPIYSQWQASKGVKPPPTNYSPYCPCEGAISGAILVSKPQQGDVFVYEPGYNSETQSIELACQVSPIVDYVNWYVDGKKISRVKWPYSDSWKINKGNHEIYATSENMKSEVIQIEVR